jgi:tRNA1Val (adenine37-N6)-methyltransferase
MNPADETLDALFGGRITLYQSRAGYRFSLDALLLAYFVTVKQRDKMIDLGTGSGVIPLVLAELYPSIAVSGVEIQPSMLERARRNVKLNQRHAAICIIGGDVRAFTQIGAPQSFDVVVCNPPYRKPGSGRISPNDEKRIARHETHGKLGDFLRAGSFLLRQKGRLAAVYPAVRSIDLLAAMRQAGIEPKRLRMVHSFAGAEAALVLAEGVKGGRSGVRILPPLAIYRRGKAYTDEVTAMIAGSKPSTTKMTKVMT